jgi:hypothetical protein
MQWRISAVAVLSACLVVGCNKGDDTTAGPVTPTPDTGVVHPTTQQLLTGPRSAKDLRYAPVTLQLPLGWDVVSYNQGSLVTLEGQTPTDVVKISIPVYRSITVDQEMSLESHAKRDFDLHPDLLPKVGVRDITGGKVIEHLIVDPAPPTTQIATTGPTTEPIQTMQWMFTVCVPTADGKGYSAYDLRFLGMTLKQYKADQAFLRSIIDSLTYAPSKEPLPN